MGISGKKVLFSFMYIGLASLAFNTTSAWTAEIGNSANNGLTAREEGGRGGERGGERREQPVHHENNQNRHVEANKQEFHGGYHGEGKGYGQGHGNININGEGNQQPEVIIPGGIDPFDTPAPSSGN